MGQDFPSVRHQRAQQLVFGWRQLHLAFPDGDQAPAQVNGQLPGSEHRLPGWRGRTTQRRPHARQQLAHAKRFRDVVVGPGIQGCDLGPLLLLHRHDDDRYLRPFAQQPRHLDSIHVGQTQVEDDQIGPMGSGRRQGLLPIHGLEHAIAMGVERCAQEAANRRLIVHHQDARSTIGHDVSPPGAASAGSQGRATVTIVPPPGRFCAQIRPRCASIIPWQIANPNPVPLAPVGRCTR